MQELTPKQLERIKKLAEIIDAGELALATHLFELEDKLDDKIPALSELIEKLRSEIVPPPSKEELLEEIKSLIPPAEKGEPGKDYVLTDTDKEEIASKIEVPVVEKVIETVIHETPIVTENVVEKAVAENADKIRDKLESLKGEERLDASAIKDLDKKELALADSIIARAIGIVDNRTSYLINKVTDLQNRINNLPTTGGGAVDSVNGQTGVVVLDADDIDDTSTTHKFTTAGDITKLAGIEALADVTDATNVAAAGALMLDGSNTGTPELGDILYFDGNDYIKFPKPGSFGSYYLANNSSGSLSWALQAAAATPTWSSVLAAVGGTTSGGNDPRLSTDDHLEFRDADIYIYSSAADTLDIVSDGTIVLNPTTSTNTAKPIVSTLATGTAPFTVASTTKVTNLNADLLDDKNTGTSGNVIPLMDGTNTWSGSQTFSNGVLKVRNSGNTASATINTIVSSDAAYSIPPAPTGGFFVMSNIAQTITGIKTHSADLRVTTPGTQASSVATRSQIDNFVLQAANEDRTNSTLADATTLQFPATLAAGTYEFELFLVFDGQSVTSGVKVQFYDFDAVLTSPSVAQVLIASGSDTTRSDSGDISSGGSVSITLASVSEAAGTIKGRMVVGLNERPFLAWAQETTNATAMRLMAGSFLKYKLLV